MGVTGPGILYPEDAPDEYDSPSARGDVGSWQRDLTAYQPRPNVEEPVAWPAYPGGKFTYVKDGQEVPDPYDSTSAQGDVGSRLRDVPVGERSEAPGGYITVKQQGVDYGKLIQKVAREQPHAYEGPIDGRVDWDAIYNAMYEEEQ